ncbi:MAG: hypothetical protein JWQ72_1288, partial [Polaromonas sp.]|nr:hypothetical protein [Polaromonas sp.]
MARVWRPMSASWALGLQAFH